MNCIKYLNIVKRSKLAYRNMIRFLLLVVMLSVYEVKQLIERFSRSLFTIKWCVDW